MSAWSAKSGLDDWTTGLCRCKSVHHGSQAGNKDCNGEQGPRCHLLQQNRDRTSEFRVLSGRSSWVRSHSGEHEEKLPEKWYLVTFIMRWHALVRARDSQRSSDLRCWKHVLAQDLRCDERVSDIDGFRLVPQAWTQGTWSTSRRHLVSPRY